MLNYKSVNSLTTVGLTIIYKFIIFITFFVSYCFKMDDIILNAPVIIEGIEFPDQSDLLNLLIELKGDCFFNAFICKYPHFFICIFTQLHGLYL